MGIIRAKTWVAVGGLLLFAGGKTFLFSLVNHLVTGLHTQTNWVSKADLSPLSSYCILSRVFNDYSSYSLLVNGTHQCARFTKRGTNYQAKRDGSRGNHSSKLAIGKAKQREVLFSLNGISR